MTTRAELQERVRRSFFRELAADPEAVRVCGGTSCVLAGASGPRDASERNVYCLGYCDRSPVRLHPDGRVECGEAPEPAVRCVAAEPVVTERIGVGDFSELSHARGAGVYTALESALTESPDAVLDALDASGERGRGGAGFPTGDKWRRCAQVRAPEKVVIANGDEGDPGSFVDRVLMERDPHAILEGLALCAHAVGASQGIVYVRGEYPAAGQRMQEAVDAARAAGLLGRAVLGSGFDFDVRVVAGEGSYVCGEETALLNALEGRRGEVRLRPPYPVEQGLHGRPTVVNNVETLVNVPWILRHGADVYARLGSPGCSGTKVLSLSAGFLRPGLLEVEFGTPLRRVIEQEGGGGRGAPLEGVILGGPMGSVLFADAWDLPIDYSAMAARGVQLGHGGLVALPEGTDYAALLRHWLAFLAEESCGKCVPCRLGSRRALELASGETLASNRDDLVRMLELIRDGSLCAFGQNLPRPVSTLLARAVGDLP